jgi:hypothetical protein
LVAPASPSCALHDEALSISLALLACKLSAAEPLYRQPDGPGMVAFGSSLASST